MLSSSEIASETIPCIPCPHNMFDIIDKASEAMVERMFLDLLKPLGRNELKDAVRDNTSLLEEASRHTPKKLALAEKMAKQFSECSHLFTAENVMKWIKDKRPDMYLSIMSDEKAYAWLERNTKEFADFLFSY